MLQCPNCHEKQDAGKFCGKCGTAVEEVIVVENDVIQTGEEESEDSITDELQEQEMVHDSLEKVDGEQEGQEFSNPTVDVQADTTTIDQDIPLAAEEIEQAIKQKAPAEVQAVGPVSHEAAIPVQETTVPPNQTTENVKKEASKYWDYCLLLVKNPTRAFQLKENSFMYGLINLVLLAVTFALTLYFAINVYYKVSFGMFSGSENLPFAPFFMRASFLVLLFLAVAIVGILIMEKFTIKQSTPKELIAQYGGVITPLIFVQSITIIAALSGSIIITAIVLLGSLLFSIFIMPGLFMFEKVSRNNISGQQIYISMGTTILNGILIYFIIRITVLNFIKEFADEISYFL